ncbi:secreted RxLR effector protein 161-like [Benincasa hispida]|uniref:secreted RxLR effector protein 161-like n=1 Tax=Benincasa hispida TaxID=102211 RepID=UPI0019000F5B|nr:secreted RxLR effector protein 161-like [Benincasa hispida]
MKPCPTLAVPGTSLSLSIGTPLHDPFLYRSTVGALQYHTNTRSDIAFIVNKLSYILKASTNIHWSIVERELRYLAGTLHFGLTTNCDTYLNLTAYSEADWASSIDDKKSTAAYCLYLQSTLISWSFKKQMTVARSSTESEYRAITHAATKIIWVKNLLTEIGFSPKGILVLWCDNMGAGASVANPILCNEFSYLFF